MAGARVEDLEAIRMFRATLVKFIESGGAALTDAESEITKRMGWLEGEQSSYWQNAIRKMQEKVTSCKEAVRMKKLFKDSAGKSQSAFDEEKKLKQAQTMLAHAEEKLANTRRWAKQLQREHLMYRGGVQRLQTMITNELPNGVHLLENVLVQIDQYLNGDQPALAPSQAGQMSQAAGDGPGAGNMHRSADAELPAETAPAVAADEMGDVPPQQAAASAGEPAGQRTAEPENA